VVPLLRPVTVSWAAASGASSYNVYQGTAAGAEAATPVKTGLTGTSVAISPLNNGTTYFFKVAAVNAGGTSALSAEASATPTATPAAPTGVTATAGTGQVTLHWVASSGATGYNIYKSTSPGHEAPPVALAVSGGSSTGGTVTGLSSGTTYYFVVQAIDASGHSPSSSEVSAKVN
jgi:predicted phage tail protein